MEDDTILTSIITSNNSDPLFNQFLSFPDQNVDYFSLESPISTSSPISSDPQEDLNNVYNFSSNPAFESQFFFNNNSSPLSDLSGSPSSSSPPPSTDIQIPISLDDDDEELNQEPTEDSTGKKKRGRKRSRRGENESLDVSAVDISRDMLLKITSEEYDAMLKKVTDNRPLTWAEGKHIKSQRRLIKNRESAQASRQRKKNLMDDLSTQVEELKQQNNKLNQEVNHLRSENRGLRDELVKLQNIIKKTAVSLTPNKLKSGVVLLIALFSFGLLFNIHNNNNGLNPKTNLPVIPSSSSSFSNSVLPKILESAISSVNSIGGINSNNNQRLQHGRTLMEVKEPVDNTSQDRIMADQQQEQEQDHQILVSNERERQNGKGLQTIENNQIYERIYQERERLLNERVVKLEQQLLEQQQIAASSPQIIQTRDDNNRIHKRIDILDSESQTRLSSELNNGIQEQLMEEFSNESVPNKINGSRGTQIDDESLKTYFDEEVIKYRRNTAYFTCTNFRQLTPPNPEPFDSDSPFYISFIVPSSSLPSNDDKLQSSSTSSNDVVSNSIVEINCKVIDVNISPAGQLSAPVAVVS